MAEVYRVTTAGLLEFSGTFPCKSPNAMVGEYCSVPHFILDRCAAQKTICSASNSVVSGIAVTRRFLAASIFGKPTERMALAAKVIAEGLQSVLDNVRPGVVCEELANAWKAAISRYGVEKDSRIG
ncbi:hypothetical protein MTR72_15615 [Bradyrhizobium sp. ISRA442]|uniref:M24 family metallopeptidase n=1 Tax=Bradyrhizobium sp. ISRA442 TaxID=2866197 RepID=UPI00311AD120